MEYETRIQVEDIYPNEPILNHVDNNIPVMNGVIHKPSFQITYNDELKNSGSINSIQGFYKSSTNITKDSF